MIDGFVFVLQMLVGFILVLFYYLVFFVFNVVFLFIMYVVWKIWGCGVKCMVIELFNVKYDFVKWLYDIVIVYEFFKLVDYVEYVGCSIEGYISNYVKKYKSYFYYIFLQVVMFLLMYVVVSVLLFGIGGVLVV